LSGDNKQEFFSDGVIEDIPQATIFFSYYPEKDIGIQKIKKTSFGLEVSVI
jgi:hypothetical protein